MARSKKLVKTKPFNKTAEKKKEKLLKKKTLETKLNNQKEVLNKRKDYKPPFQILLDTNFILHSIKKKIPLTNLTTQTFLSNITINIPRCVFSELEKLKNFLAIKLLNNTNHNKLICDHKGDYADDCIYNRAVMNRCYIVATSDKGLKNRLRNSAIPIVYVKGFKYTVEGMFI